MKPAYTHNMMKLSRESSWYMLRKLVFSDGELQLSDELKELGIDIVKKCGGLPLAIKAIAGVLVTRERTKKEWDSILRSDIWSIKDLHGDHIAGLQLSFEDLPSHLKQCFLYFSLYGEDILLGSDQFARLWVAEGFITENKQGSLIEDVAEKYFNELLGRNLLLWDSYREVGNRLVWDANGHRYLFPEGRTIDSSFNCKMHDLVRSLVIFLSKEEISFEDVKFWSSTTFKKLRRLSIEDKKSLEATEIFDLVAKQGALRTLLARNSDLLLNEERLKRILCLRVLDISSTKIKELPDTIGDLVHLRYLDISWSDIRAIPETIEHLSYLQFLDISYCQYLIQLPNGITKLHNLRYLNLFATPIMFMPKGIEKLQQLNHLDGFKTDNTDTSSKLEDLNSLKQIRKLRLLSLDGARSEAIILKELSYLSYLVMNFSYRNYDVNNEVKLALEELSDQIIPPQSLEELTIENFFGRRFPNWMASSSFKNYVPNLTQLRLNGITSCAQLPPLGQLPELKNLYISHVVKLKKIGSEFLGVRTNSTTNIAFPKLGTLWIEGMNALKEWCFGTQVEVNASSRLEILPRLYKLIISKCPMLKQLPEGLKHLSMLKELRIIDCRALSSVANLSSLQLLEYMDRHMKSLPDWLLMLLRQQGLQNKQDFLFQLFCKEEIIEACLEGGYYWDLIQQIPRVNVSSLFGRAYLRYNKHPYV